MAIKINDKRITKAQLCDLSIGATFMFNQELWMKISHGEDFDEVLLLEKGTKGSMNTNTTFVTTVDIEINIL